MLKYLLSQSPLGAVHIGVERPATLLRLSQLRDIDYKLINLPVFDIEKFKEYYGTPSPSALHRALQFGFEPGDTIVAQYRGSIIIKTGRQVYVVDPMRGSRYIIQLSDSELSGRRLTIKMMYDMELALAKKIIDDRLHTHFERLTTPRP